VTISTYSELSTAIGTYMGRSDLSSRADEFIDNVKYIVIGRACCYWCCYFNSFIERHVNPSWVR